MKEAEEALKIAEFSYRQGESGLHLFGMTEKETKDFQWWRLPLLRLGTVRGILIGK